jgi:hypothetical protein
VALSMGVTIFVLCLLVKPSKTDFASLAPPHSRHAVY